MKKKIYEAGVPTRWGTFSVQATERGLFSLRFPGRKTAATPFQKSDSKILRRAGQALQQYFEGKPRALKALPVDWRGLSPFEGKVLKTLARVPSGKRLTYQALAKRSSAEGAARAVGTVMRKNRLPIVLPCHRVVRTDGGLGGYQPGLAWKKRLLALEQGVA